MGIAMVSTSDDLHRLVDVVAELRVDLAEMHVEIQLARAEQDEMLSIVKRLAGALQAGDRK
jgi:hypothetical protein